MTTVEPYEIPLLDEMSEDDIELIDSINVDIIKSNISSCVRKALNEISRYEERSIEDIMSMVSTSFQVLYVVPPTLRRCHDGIECLLNDDTTKFTMINGNISYVNEIFRELDLTYNRRFINVFNCDGYCYGSKINNIVDKYDEYHIREGANVSKFINNFPKYEQVINESIECGRAKIIDAGKKAIVNIAEYLRKYNNLIRRAIDFALDAGAVDIKDKDD